MTRRLRPPAAGAALALLLGAAARSDEPAPPPTAADTAAPAAAASDPLDPARRAIELLAARGLAADAGRLAPALLEAVVRAADAGGRVLSNADAGRLARERDGAETAVEVRLAPTNLHLVVAAAGAGATAAGFTPGLRLVSVEGQPSDGRLPFEVERDFSAGTGTSVRVEVRAGGEEKPRTLVLAKAPRQRPALRAEEEWPRELVYFSVNGLYAGSGAPLAARLREAARAGRDGIILDLRGAGGGSLADAAAVASLLARPGSDVFRVEPSDAAATPERFAAGGEPLPKGPVMVLVDRRTSGAAEALAAALKVAGRGAMVLGEATAGDPLVREALPLDGERSLHVRTRRIRLADDTLLDGSAGVAPHLAVRAGPGANGRDYEPEPQSGGRRKTLEAEKADRELRDRVRADAVLQRAVDILLGLKALDSSHAPNPPG